MPLEPTVVVELHHKLNKLKREYAQVDKELTQLSTQPPLISDFQVHRLKKRKILIQDQIQKIDALLVPNIIA